MKRYSTDEIGELLSGIRIKEPKTYCKNCKLDTVHDIGYMYEQGGMLQCCECGLELHSSAKGDKFILNGKEINFGEGQ